MITYATIISGTSRNASRGANVTVEIEERAYLIVFSPPFAVNKRESCPKSRFSPFRFLSRNIIAHSVSFQPMRTCGGR